MKGQLHPAWFKQEPGEKCNDICFQDSISEYIRRMEALGSLMTEHDDQLPGETVDAIGSIIMDMSNEAKLLVELWGSERRKPRVVAGSGS